MSSKFLLIVVYIVTFYGFTTNAIDCSLTTGACVCTEPGPCQLDCKGDQICKTRELFCKGSETCDIACNGTGNVQACESARIHASTATDVTLSCAEQGDCLSMNFTCGTGKKFNKYFYPYINNEKLNIQKKH